MAWNRAFREMENTDGQDDVVIMYWYGVVGRRKILRLYRVGGTMAGGEST